MGSFRTIHSLERAVNRLAGTLRELQYEVTVRRQGSKIAMILDGRTYEFYAEYAKAEGPYVYI